MTDKVFALTVLLSEDVREDDAKAIVNAIGMMRNVQKVETHVSDVSVWAGEERARQKLGQKLWEVLYPKSSSGEK